MSSNSMWRRSLLVLALGLATQAGAQTVPAAPAAPAPSPTKPSLKAAPAKPGSGMTANISVSEGSGGTGGNGQCTVTQDGTVECTGSSSGAGDGPGWYGGGGLPNEYPQGKPSTGGNGAGGAAGPSAEDELTRRRNAINACQKDYKAAIKTIEDRFTQRSATCVAKNGGGIGPITYGVIDDALGVFGLSCYDRALDARNAETFKANEANLDCLQRARNG